MKENFFFFFLLFWLDEIFTSIFFIRLTELKIIHNRDTIRSNIIGSSNKLIHLKNSIVFVRKIYEIIKKKKKKNILPGARSL
jgi:hypothetical protein